MNSSEVIGDTPADTTAGGWWTDPTSPDYQARIQEAGFNSTEEYCDPANKLAQPDATYMCDWPNVPPFCEQSWTEYVGPSKVTMSKLVYFVLFFILFVLQSRMSYWSWQRLQAKKKSFWDKTANEWVTFYGKPTLGVRFKNSQHNPKSSNSVHPHSSAMVMLVLRLVQELDFGNELGIMNFKVTFILTKTISGVMVCCLYSVSWGWYKVLLPNTDKAAKVKQADLFHNIFRIITVLVEGGAGVLGVFMLDDEYANAGVYSGNVHGISRAILFVLCIFLTGFLAIMGNNIKKQLASGGAVAPAAPAAPAPGEKKVKKKGDDQKIAKMVKSTLVVMVIVQLYVRERALTHSLVAVHFRIRALFPSNQPSPCSPQPSLTLSSLAGI